MGNRFEITVIVPQQNEAWGNQCIAKAIKEIQRIEHLFTTYNPLSETNLINQNAGIAPVKVCTEMMDIILRAQKISDITQGAFDISYGSVDKQLWNFDKNLNTLPSAETAKKMVYLINYKNIIINKSNHTIFLKNKGMRIGFGGIGKGYAAEKAKTLLQQLGVQSGIVNAAGDLTTWGCQQNGKPWTIGLADPNNAQQPFSYLNISNLAIATSGNYEKFVTINGKKYSHTINPKTGLPISGIKSVSIICPNAEIADALATPVTIMGVKVGLHMINQMKNIACIIIDDNNNLYHSNNINLN